MDSLLSEEIFEYVYNVFYLLLFVVSFFTVLKYDLKKVRIARYKYHQYIVKLFILSAILIVGFRAYDVGTDTYNYYFYSWVNNFKSESKTEIFFDFIIDFLKNNRFSFSIFLLLISALFYSFIYKAFKNISFFFEANIIFLLFAFFSLFFSRSLSINVIRQGLSLAILFYAYSLWLTSKNTKLQILLCVLSIMTHTTSIISLVLFICVINLSKIALKYYLILFFLGIVLSAFGLGVLSIAPFLGSYLGDDRYGDYLNGSIDTYTVGFKPQFVVFNLVFVIMGYFALNKILTLNSDRYKCYLISFKFYLVASFVFFMMFQIPFSDRFGLFSWMFISVLVAPYFSYKPRYIRSQIQYVLFFGLIYLFFAVYT